MEGGYDWRRMDKTTLYRYVQRAGEKMTEHHPQSIEGVRGWFEGTQDMEMLSPDLPAWVFSDTPPPLPPRPKQMWEAMGWPEPKNSSKKAKKSSEKPKKSSSA